MVRAQSGSAVIGAIAPPRPAKTMVPRLVTALSCMTVRQIARSKKPKETRQRATRRNERERDVGASDGETKGKTAESEQDAELQSQAQQGRDGLAGHDLCGCGAAGPESFP